MRIVLDLDMLPLSPRPASAWLSPGNATAAALAQLATGGDDYQIVCTADPTAAGRRRRGGGVVFIEPDRRGCVAGAGVTAGLT